MTHFVLASTNDDKYREFCQLLEPLGIEITKQSKFNIDEADETASSFVENALIKARHACQQSGMPTLADDSGLMVPALNGAPGVYSARYAGTPSDAQANIKKLLAEMQTISPADHQAIFVCVLVLLRYPEDPAPIICQGFWQGTILRQMQGEHGFGYDPIFYIDTEDCTAAELTSNRKNYLSHRGKAFKQLKEALLANGYTS